MQFLNAQQAVLDYIDENTDEAISETAQFLDLEEEAVRDMYANYDFDMEIRNSDIESMQNTVDFMLESGMIENDVDIESLVVR